MPTILLVIGWRFFFYANEGNEPIHIHCRKGDMECKYWLDLERFDLEEEFAHNMGPRDRREVKRIIYEYFDFIEEQWNSFHNQRRDENES